mgnify:CR=1 FL=1
MDLCLYPNRISTTNSIEGIEYSGCTLYITRSQTNLKRVSKSLVRNRRRSDFISIVALGSLVDVFLDKIG